MNEQKEVYTMEREMIRSNAQKKLE